MDTPRPERVVDSLTGAFEKMMSETVVKRRAVFDADRHRIDASIRLGIMAEEDWDGPSIKPGTLTDEQIAWLASWLAGESIGSIAAAETGLLERMADDWRLFKRHHPVGAYLPTGQLDGDCSCGKGSWPCPDVLETLRVKAPGD